MKSSNSTRYPKYYSVRRHPLLKGLSINNLFLIVLVIYDLVGDFKHIQSFLKSYLDKNYIESQTPKADLLIDLSLARLIENKSKISEISNLSFQKIDTLSYELALELFQDKHQINYDSLSYEIIDLNNEKNIKFRKKNLLSWYLKFLDHRNLADYIGVTILFDQQFRRPHDLLKHFKINYPIVADSYTHVSTHGQSILGSRGYHKVLQGTTSHKHLKTRFELRLIEKCTYHQSIHEHRWYNFVFKQPRYKSIDLSESELFWIIIDAIFHNSVDSDYLISSYVKRYAVITNGETKFQDNLGAIPKESTVIDLSKFL